MEQADSLSRRTDQIKGVEINDKNQGILKKKQLGIRTIEKRPLLIEKAEEEIIEKIKKSEVKDNKVVKTVKKIKKIGVKILRNSKWQIESELVLKEENIYT